MAGLLFDDSFYVPERSAEAALRERGSRFYSFAFPAQSDADAKHFLTQLRQKYPDATHHCYALVLGADSSYRKASDDGEPSNSAGQPILRAIQSAGLTQTLVVVVRYFGGTQLGIPGLIKAYGDSAKLALAAAGKAVVFIRLPVSFTVDAADIQVVYRLLQGLDVEMDAPRFEADTVTLVARIRRNDENKLQTRLNDAHKVVAKWL